MAQISSIVFFSLVAFISAEQELQVGAPERKLKSSPQCTLAISVAVQKAATIGTTLWAAIDRCEKAGENEKEVILCTSDLFAIMEMTLEMSQWIIQSVESCGGAIASKCTLTNLGVAADSSGIIENALEMSQECDPEKVGAISGLSVRTPMSDNVDCNSDVAAAIGNLGAMIAGFQHMQCTSDADCFAKSLSLSARLVDVANAIWNAATQSCIQQPGMSPWFDCADEVMNGAADILSLASHAMKLSPNCNTLGGAVVHKNAYYDASVPQLTGVSGFSALIAGLAALFSLTAIAAFIRRSRTKKDTCQPASDMETQPLQDDVVS
jgi:hypothetical protein